uniref:Fe2OG dioxygenase domain-containing protein n=1 Tax=Chromera velia CCMP2878 TaxID=1169474 RepID=A0A0G4FTF2_9ALVE|eukprot:Cvel_18681.t1-p1 / transcript=Cvel_18681.t1 / gene=Cvel_18681 / organism=Chromera_velia_CCMP2878 / gene_product=Probable iron/ascorbate oxidoreductase DDB_G0283291, putative / transcript_product=Probable iron/ascorbate oxidoreductase DDB_G0283291, putative / location=Cvel_scaffold1563:15400-17368(-) / protein_length=314 / sequence_SO=supercontig / SO=protein_coding / is_pseudo=false
MSEEADVCVAKVRRACCDFGFFLLTGHGLSEEEMAGALQLVKDLFALPSSEKQKMSSTLNKLNRGYTAMSEETLDPEKQSEGDTKEGFYMGREVAADSPEAQTPLTGPNVWPPEDVLPGWRRGMEQYYEKMTALGHRLLRLVARSLQIEPDFFDAKFRPGMRWLRPLHYAPQKSDVEKGVLGAGEHTDYGMLTILLTDGIRGLEILPKKEGQRGTEWVEVPHVQGGFVVNLGDMLERWTNGVYMSTPHRVVMKDAVHRYSLPFFFEPNFDCRVETVSTCVEDGQPPLYPPVVFGEHLLGKYAKTHKDFEGKPKD